MPSFIKGEVLRIEELTEAPQKNYDLVVDRIIVRKEEDFYQRMADAVEIAFYEGKGAFLSGHWIRKRGLYFAAVLS